MITIRLLRRVVAWNALHDHTLYEGEVFLAQPLSVFEHRRWEPHFGKLPRGHKALAVFAESDRILCGEALVVGVEGVDWEVTGSAHVQTSPRSELQ